MHHRHLFSLSSIALVACLALPALPVFADNHSEGEPPVAVETAAPEQTVAPEAVAEETVEETIVEVPTPETFEERVKRAVEQAKAAAMEAQKSKEDAVRNVLATEDLIKQYSARISALQEEAETKQAEMISTLEATKQQLNAEIEEAKTQAANAVAEEIKKMVETIRQMLVQQIETQLASITNAQLNDAIEIAEKSAIEVVTAKFAEAQVIQDHAVQNKTMLEGYQTKIDETQAELEAAKAEKMTAIQDVLAKETAAKAAMAKYKAAKAAADKFHAEKEAARLEAIKRAAEQFDKELQQADE